MFASFPVFNTFDACVDIIDVDADVDADEDCTNNKEVNEDSTGSVVLLTPVPAVPRYVSVAGRTGDIEETVVVTATAGDDDVSEDEPPGCYDHIVTHTLRPVIDFAALNADGGDYTDEEWAAYLKIRKVQERREREREKEALPNTRKENLAP